MSERRGLATTLLDLATCRVESDSSSRSSHSEQWDSPQLAPALSELLNALAHSSSRINELSSLTFHKSARMFFSQVTMETAILSSLSDRISCVQVMLLKGCVALNNIPT